jgi:hypothetical protein
VIRHLDTQDLMSGELPFHPITTVNLSFETADFMSGEVQFRPRRAEVPEVPVWSSPVAFGQNQHHSATAVCTASLVCEHQVVQTVWRASFGAWALITRSSSC